MDSFTFASQNARSEFAIEYAQIAKAIRKQFPEVYRIGGIGWCGPQWQEAEALEAQLKAQA